MRIYTCMFNGFFFWVLGSGFFFVCVLKLSEWNESFFGNLWVPPKKELAGVPIVCQILARKAGPLDVDFGVLLSTSSYFRDMTLYVIRVTLTSICHLWQRVLCRVCTCAYIRTGFRCSVQGTCCWRGGLFLTWWKWVVCIFSIFWRGLQCTLVSHTHTLHGG